ncbi:hypothetical protein [Pseudomonas phage MYY9]|uniref:Uncharacterized protein n=1 Tax=Pseudomonas phage MYY9 TaxID=2798805 RepID=A0A7T7G046_9CAUD|nr:hypothetical protein [Pseudomonas phage MYY9]
MLSRQDREARAWHQQDAAWQRMLVAERLEWRKSRADWRREYLADRIAAHRRAMAYARASGAAYQPQG